MRLCNDTITVLNRKIDASTGYEVYYPTTIMGVSWFCRIESVVNEGLKAANSITVRIPENANFGGKSYVDPATYRNASDVSGVFTFADGDVIVKANVAGENLTPAQLKAAYTDYCTILGVTDNRRAPNAPHFKVVGT